MTAVLPDAELAEAAARKLAQIAVLAPQAARAHKALLRGLQAGAPLAQWLPTAYDYADTAEHRDASTDPAAGDQDDAPGGQGDESQ